jgi:hypothetical protein
MADNATANPGAGGVTFATDDIAGVHWPYTKHAFGPRDTATEVEDLDTKRLPVKVGESVLPSGAATDANLVLLLAGLLIAQGMSATDLKGPLAQAMVNDSPNVYVVNEVRPLSVTAEGRLRVSSAESTATASWGSHSDFDEAVEFDSGTLSAWG